MFEIKQKLQTRSIAKSSRHVLTWTFTNFKDRAELLLADKSQETNCTNIMIGIKKDLPFCIEMDISAPNTLKVMYRVSSNSTIFSVRLTSSILNSANEIEHSYKAMSIPKDMDKVLFHHDICMSTLLNEEDRLIPNDTMTILGEIVFFYKFSFQDCARITSEYIDSQSASIAFLASCDQQSLFEKRGKGDVLVSCNGAEFEAHKAILSSRSAVFSSMFDKEGPKVIIRNVEKIILQELLDFLYGNDILDKSIDFIVKMFTAVSKHDILDLKRLCSSILSINLNLDNVLKFAALADENKDYKLFAAVKKFANKNKSQLLSTSKWRELAQHSPNFAKRILPLIYVPL